MNENPKQFQYKDYHYDSESTRGREHYPDFGGSWICNFEHNYNLDYPGYVTAVGLMCHNIDDEPQDYYGYRGSGTIGSLNDRIHSIGWIGSLTGDVGAGCNDPSMNSGSYNQLNRGPNNGIFVTTYGVTVGDPYPVFGSQTAQLNVKYYHHCSVPSWTNYGDFGGDSYTNYWHNSSSSSFGKSAVGLFTNNLDDETCPNEDERPYSDSLGSSAAVSIPRTSKILLRIA